MSHTTHYKLSLFGALISSIAFTALSVFAIAPGATLDPMGDDTITCSGPGHLDCMINPYENLDANGVLYLDEDGNISTNGNFIWNDDSFLASAEINSGFIDSLGIGNPLAGFFDMQGSYLKSSTADMHNFVFVGTSDFMDDSETGGVLIGSMGAEVHPIFGLPEMAIMRFSPGEAAFQMIHFAGDYHYYSGLEFSDNETMWGISNSEFDKEVGISMSQEGEISFRFGSAEPIAGCLEEASDDGRFSCDYLFPNSRASAGQVLTDVNGDGRLSWATVSGESSPITVINTNSLVSTEIASGGTVPTGAHSVFLGQSAGYNTSVSYANFLGNAAGFAASGAHNSNFFGSSAGFSASNAFESNFFGNTAGESATNSYRSHFLGTDAGRYHSGNSEGSSNAANSIFIGYKANYTGDGYNLDNTSTNTNPDDMTSCADFDCYSILLGNYTSTGGHSNSIAIGAYATNTAENQFMIGSTTRRIEEMVFNGGVGNTCSIVAGTGISCSSDERLKKNIINLAPTLDDLNNIQTVTYNWKEGMNQKIQIGFIAQNIYDYFPEIVSINHDDMLAVNYAGMTPILTKAIQELDLKINILERQTISSGGFSLATLKSVIKDILSDVGNGIQNIFAKRVTTEELCVEDVCFNKQEAEKIKELINSGSVYNLQQQEIIVEEVDMVDNSIQDEDNETPLEEDASEDIPEEPVSTEDTTKESEQETEDQQVQPSEELAE